MLDQMALKFNGANSIEYRQGHAENLPVDTSSVDIAMANMYLHHVEDPFIALTEMTRIVKPGGMVIFCDMQEHSYDFLRTEHCDRWPGFNIEEVRQWLLRAGLKRVVVEVQCGQCCTKSECSGEEAKIDIFLAYGYK
jgi:ubiquinone/menaquinone biosynthesis C-methylase UbiE